MELNELRAFIEKQPWIFAKTYVDRASHEYIVRARASGTDEEFMNMVNYITENGLIMYFWNHPNKYINLDGHHYWVMRSGNDDPTTIINRCNSDEYKYSII